MKKTESKGEPDAIIAAALNGKRQHVGRSPIFDWMWARYEAYGEQLSQRGVNWNAMAQQFQVEGITDGRGKPPTGKTVAATFYKVRNLKTGRKPKPRPVKPKREIKRAFRRTAA